MGANQITAPKDYGSVQLAPPQAAGKRKQTTHIGQNSTLHKSRRDTRQSNIPKLVMYKKKCRLATKYHNLS